MHIEHKPSSYFPMMASCQCSSCKKSFLADCQKPFSTVCFERWESCKAARNHHVLGLTAGTGRMCKHVLTCWEANMGFPERCDAIPPDFNKVDSWQEAVTPCCHCRTFQGDQPLKKKVLKFLSHHDAGLAEQYQCDTLWEICHVPLTSESSKNSSMKTPVQVEEKDVSSVTPPQRKRDVH